MSLFTEILKESSLLLEKQNEVTEDKIRDAIENGKIVSIMYNDGEPGKGKSWRYIYPVVYGELKNRKTGAGNGHMAIRAYQTVGSTKRDKKNAWKLFRLDRIVAWYNQENTETDQSHTFDPKLLQYFSEKGDKHFARIVYHSPAINVEYSIDSKPISKDDIMSIYGKEGEQPEIKYTMNPDWKNQYNQEYSKTISLDNNGNISYPSEKGAPEASKIEAPDTKPISGDEVQTGQPQDTSVQDDAAKKMVADEKPVSKDEVNGKEPENDITPAYQDMMNRWKNAENAENKA